MPVRQKLTRRPSWVKRSGPYKCDSLTDSHILVDPSWPQYGPVWEEEQGGGPGFPGRMALAAELEAWLNASYTDEEVTAGLARIAEHKKNRRISERRFKRSIYELEQLVKQQDRRIAELEMQLENAVAGAQGQKGEP